MATNFDESLKIQQPENKKSFKFANFSNETQRLISRSILHTNMKMMAEMVLTKRLCEKPMEDDKVDIGTLITDIDDDDVFRIN